MVFRNGRVDVRVEGDGKPAPEARNGAGFNMNATWKCFFEVSFGLMNLAIAEVWRKLHGAGLDDVCRRAAST